MKQTSQTARAGIMICLLLTAPLRTTAQLSADWKFTLLLPNEPLTVPSGETVRPGDIFLSDNSLVFTGLEKEGVDVLGIYRLDGSTITKIADTRTSLPNKGDWFASLSRDIVSYRDQIAFTGGSKEEQESSGLYLYQKGKISVIADKNATLPQSKVKFNSAFLSLNCSAMNARHFVFTATGKEIQGLYSREKDGSLIRIIDNTMTIPETDLKFKAADWVSLVGDRIVFSDYRSRTRHGLYLYDHGKITVLGNENTLVPGKDIPFLQFSRLAFSEKRSVCVGIYKQEEKLQSEIFEFTPKGIGLLLDLNHLPQLLPPDPDFTYAPGTLLVDNDTLVFTVGRYREPTGYYAENQLFYNRGGVTKPVLKVGDIVDGKALEYFNSLRFDAGRLVLFLKFKGNSSGYYSAEFLPRPKQQTEVTERTK